MDVVGGVHHKFDEHTFFQRPEVPISQPSSSQGLVVESVASKAFVSVHSKYVAELTSWKVA